MNPNSPPYPVTALPLSLQNFWDGICTPTAGKAVCHRCGLGNLEVRTSGGARYALCPTHGILTLSVPGLPQRRKTRRR